ncbi:hypothetical protein [Listeria booriae]|uniref:hypothetical protein n=1 Tax=Listeria booriae TaxID=1552123 RepID=UPI00162758F6|nr:hypothetical protein [Listeria booriae]MBC2195266.1 hypothetical protein [Listeria booriae]
MILNESDIFAIDEMDLGNKIINKQTVLIPYSNQEVDVYVNEEEKLPPISDAVLRLYKVNDDYSFDEMGEILGIDGGEVNNAYLSLLEKNLIDYISRSITDEGRRYINDRKINNRKKQSITVAVNKITGDVSYQEEGAFIKYSDKQSSIFKCPYEQNSQLSIQDSITFDRVTRLWNYRKKIDEYRYKGDISEILKKSQKNTVYKKYNIYYFMNEQNEVEMRAYERTRRDKVLEQFIWLQESSNPQLTKKKYDYYFEKNVRKKNNDFYKYQDIDFQLDIFKTFSFFDDAQEKIQVFIPIHNFSLLNDELLYYLKKAIEKGIKIEIFFNGFEWVSIQQRIFIEEILYLGKYGNVKIYSTRNYCPQTIIIDESEGKIFAPKIFNFSIEGTDGSSVMLTFTSMDEKQHKYLKENLVKESISKMDIPDTFCLDESCLEIVDKTEKLDDAFSSNSTKLTWFSQNDKREFDKFFSSVKQAVTKAKYESFTTTFSRKVVENFKANSKKRGKKYFDSDFREEYPQLSFSMNRIRVYRNSYSHEFLDKNFIKMSHEIIAKDFDGYCPIGISNIFEYKQYKMITEHKLALIDTIDVLGKQEESPF